MPADHSPSPARLDTIADIGPEARLYASCRRCSSDCRLDLPALLAAHGALAFDALKARLRCDECGARGPRDVGLLHVWIGRSAGTVGQPLPPGDDTDRVRAVGLAYRAERNAGRHEDQAVEAAIAEYLRQFPGRTREQAGEDVGRFIAHTIREDPEWFWREVPRTAGRRASRG